MNGKTWHSIDHSITQLHVFGVIRTFTYFIFMGQTKNLTFCVKRINLCAQCLQGEYSFSGTMADDNFLSCLLWALPHPKIICRNVSTGMLPSFQLTSRISDLILSSKCYVSIYNLNALLCKN